MFSLQVNTIEKLTRSTKYELGGVALFHNQDADQQWRLLSLRSNYTMSSSPPSSMCCTETMLMLL